MSNDRAVVIGASIAGLLAAAALAEHMSEVVVVDRDTLPVDAAARAGVPQGRQVHGLLARGREAMEELLPGLTDELVEKGALLGDFQLATRFLVGGRPLAMGESGLLSVGVSRALLEREVRRRVESIPGVTIRDRTAVLGLAVEPGADPGAGAVVGVGLSGIDWPGTCEVLDAGLVVDASGRNSRTPEWLVQAGYPAPSEERMRIDTIYATRTFRRTPGELDGVVAAVSTVGESIPRAALMIAQEGDRWTAGITGYFGDRPPVDLPGFLAYARTCDGPLGEIFARLEPLDDGSTYRFPANVRRRYERLRRFPAGLLVIGDALCAFDPSYGQGMSVAAIEAVDLRALLRDGQRRGQSTADFSATDFFRRCARHIDTPWMLVVGRDRSLPGSPHPVPVQTRLINAYMRSVLAAATIDPAVARTFHRVNHLVAPPSALFAPAFILRVVAPRRRGRSQAAEWDPFAPAISGAEATRPQR